MSRLLSCGLILAIFFGSTGCGKEDPKPEEGVNPFEKRFEDKVPQKDKKPIKNPMREP